MIGNLVVGFDLDMTLFNTHPSIEATLLATRADLGVEFDVAEFMRELGPPLPEMVSRQLPPDLTKKFVDHYRDIYHLHGLAAAALLPGARESIAAVRHHGGRSIVITGKNHRDARRHIEHARLDVSHVVGWAWAETKMRAMLEHDAWAYVGDHPADIAAARAAGAFAVAVTTGTHGARDFDEADTVLDSLAEFPKWMSSRLSDPVAS